MTYRTRINYTSAQKTAMWERWQRGESLNAIGRVFDRHASSIFHQLSVSGGIRSQPHKRSKLALTLHEREEISRGIVSGLLLRCIAQQLRRSPLTISREVNRNDGVEHYRANQADKSAWDRAHRPKPSKRALHPALKRIVAEKLKRNWSPEQIDGWLKRNIHLMRINTCHMKRYIAVYLYRLVACLKKNSN